MIPKICFLYVCEFHLKYLQLCQIFPTIFCGTNIFALYCVNLDGWLWSSSLALHLRLRFHQLWCDHRLHRGCRAVSPGRCVGRLVTCQTCCSVPCTPPRPSHCAALLTADTRSRYTHYLPSPSPANIILRRA